MSMPANLPTARSFAIDQGQQRLAESMGGEARQQHVGVEDDPHETALKTSSSVTNPWASARGTVIFRTAVSCSLTR